MKASEIVLKLMETVPNKTDLFSSFFYPDSISISGSRVTVGRTAHGFSTGDIVCFTAGKLENSITSIIDNGDDTQTVTTAGKTDLTEGYQSTVLITSATDSSIDGDYAVIGVADDRLSFTITDFTLPAVDPGDYVLNEEMDYSVNGLFRVSKIDDDSFYYDLAYIENGVEVAYSLDGKTVEPSTLKIHNQIRITRAANIERMIANYDKQAVDDLWLCVCLGGTSTDKSANSNSDADQEQGGQNDWKSILISPFHVYVLATVDKDDISGGATRDIMEEIRPVLCSSLLGLKFNTGFYYPCDSGVYLVGDDRAEYKTASYVHDFEFSSVVMISNEDTAEVDEKESALTAVDFDINDQNGKLLSGATVTFDE